MKLLPTVVVLLLAACERRTLLPVEGDDLSAFCTRDDQCEPGWVCRTSSCVRAPGGPDGGGGGGAGGNGGGAAGGAACPVPPTVDAGRLASADSGPRDGGPLVTFEPSWALHEGSADREPFRSDLVVNNAGLVLWFVSTTSTDPASDDFGVPTGAILTVEPEAGAVLEADGGPSKSCAPGRARVALPAAHAPPTVFRSDGGPDDAVLIALALRASDGGTPGPRADGGARPPLNAFAALSLTQVPPTLQLTAVSAGDEPIAAGRLTLTSAILAGFGERRDVLVRRGAADTSVVFLPGASRTEATIPGFACTAAPSDVVTTLVDPAGGPADRLHTLSVCGGTTHLLSYSGTFNATGRWTGRDTSLGPFPSARMGIARHGTPARAPVAALAGGTFAFVTRFPPDGDPLLGPAGMPIPSRRLVAGSSPVRVEAVAVDDSNRPLVVLGTTPGQPLAITTGPSTADLPVTSASGLVLVQLTEALELRAVGPLSVGAGLRASSAVFTGAAGLLVSVTCDQPESFCGAGRGPTLVRVTLP